MRAKTIKRLAILIAVFGLIGGSGYFIWGRQVDKMARTVVAKADLAVQERRFADAENLYFQHLEVVPDDVDVQLKYADLLVKEKTPKSQEKALEIFNAILTQGRYAGRVDVRRKVAELLIDRGLFEAARNHLYAILSGSRQGDGGLEYLVGRCYEAEKDAANAVKCYQDAIDHDAPQRLEAYQRRASLLRDPLEQPKQADEAIEAMVRSNPESYQVYLERGRYRSRFGLPGAKDDFQAALKRAPDEPEIYLEMARVVEVDNSKMGLGEDKKRGLDQARQVLKDGLKAAPTAVGLYQSLAGLELRANRIEKAIETLEEGVKTLPDQIDLRLQLALLLAERRDAGKLLLQIDELKRTNIAVFYTQYLQARYHVISNEFAKARQILVPLQAEAGRDPNIKARINVLLAQCYAQLGEKELEQQALLRALSSNPEDLTARLALIDGMTNRGEIERAIEEYQQLLNQDQVRDVVRLPLVRLLIVQNQRLPAQQRNWDYATRLIDDAARAAPQSAEPVILRGQLLLVRGGPGDPKAARDLLATARARVPQSIELWTAEAALLGQQKKFDEALDLLDQAQRKLGDRVELRLLRAGLWVAKGGPKVVQVLTDLAKNLEPFSRQDRRRLLATLAFELVRQQDLPGATRLWSQLAVQDPNDLEPRLQLLDLALRSTDKAQIEKHIKVIEGIDGLMGGYCQVLYLIWQAQHTNDKNSQEIQRTNARTLLGELKSRRPDWSRIPLAEAELQEQELAQGGLDENQKRQRQESLINSYLRAIELGQRGTALVRRVVQLLLAVGRGNEVLERIPMAPQLAGDLGQMAMRFALENRDYEQAEEIARRAVAAKPNDFQERLWLVQVLLAAGNLDGAETEIRKAIDLSKSDPDRWSTLVKFMILTKQPEKAEQAVRDAETNLPQAPLALAQCCQSLGRAFDGGNADDQVKVKKWYDAAEQWYAKAQAAQKDGSDFSIARRVADFFLQTKQIDKAEKLLNDILGRSAGAKNAAMDAWARRTLALTYIARPDRERARQALALLEAAGRQGKTLDDADDLRVLAWVLNAQGTPEDRMRAIEVLESLISKNLASSEDHFLLAQLEEVSGDWPKAREQYRELILRTDNLRDMETLNRRPVYLFRFATSLFRNRRTGEEQDLKEIREVVEKLKQVQPDVSSTVALEVELDRVSNQLDKAEELIRSYANRPALPPQALKSLASLAEKIERFELAGELYNRLASGPTSELQGRLALAEFLGRRGNVKGAIDICESVWPSANARARELVTAVCLEILFDSKDPFSPKSSSDEAQCNRVVGWLDQALKVDPKATNLQIGLGNFRERQQRYQDAKEQYLRAIGAKDQSGIAYNNLAWLTTLMDPKGRDALDLINQAIQLKGPLPDLLDTRGVVYLNVGENKRAVADLEAAVAAASSASKLFHLSQAYLKVNEREKAKQSLKDAKAKGLPDGLHPLEQTAYHQVLSELDAP
jgi:tetratricopeptide (TPR) repeat protein